MTPIDAEGKPSWAEQTPVLWPGRWPDVWSPKRALSQKLCGSCLSQKLLASVVHTLTCSDYFRRSPGTNCLDCFNDFDLFNFQNLCGYEFGSYIKIPLGEGTSY